MTRNTINKDFEVTYEIIIKSYLKELKENGKKIIEYEDLTDDEKLQIIAQMGRKIKIIENGEGLNFFMKHIIQANVFWFHEKWNKLHIKYKNLCIVAPRGVGKTYWANHILPIYHSATKIQFFPDTVKPPKMHESMIIGYNEEMAKKFLADPRDSIETNEFLKNLIGQGANADWNKMQLDMENRTSIIAKSFSGAIRGYHEAGIVIADDLLSDKSELSPQILKSSLNNIVKPITRRFRARFLLVGTRFSEDDIYASSEERANIDDGKGLYGFYNIWVELDHDNKKVYICEQEGKEIKKHLDTGISDIYDYAELAEAQMEDPISFAREYECKIVSDKEVPFPSNVLLESRDMELSYEYEADKKKSYKGGLDSSNSTNKDSDETVLMIGYKDADNNIVPARIFADNTLIAPERITSMKNIMIDFKRPEILAEKNSMGQTNIDFINKDMFYLIPFNTSRTSKIDITEMAEKIVKGKRLKLPYKTAEDRRITDKLIHQLSGVREKKTRTGLRSYTGTTKHDDYYIAFILMVKQLLEGAGRLKISSYKRTDFNDY